MVFSRAFLVAGGMTLASALVWWWSTFNQVVWYGYISWFEAGRCLVGDSDLCALARKLCLGAHPSAYTPYAAKAFWIASALLSSSAILSHGPASIRNKDEKRDRINVLNKLRSRLDWA